jgi:cysteine desulfurase
MAVVRRTRDEAAPRVRALRDRLEAGLLSALPGARVVGGGAPRLPNTLSLVLPPGAEGGDVVRALDRRGIAVSAGSACHAGERHASRVLLAMGLSPGEAFRAVRVSLGPGTTAAEVDRVLEALPEVFREVAA